MSSCPYVLCANMLLPGAAGQVCACELREPILRCAHCGMENRDAARACRRCAAPLEAPAASAIDAGHTPFSLTFAGRFARPAASMHQHLYAADAQGRLHSLSLTQGASPKAFAALNPATAFNSAACISVGGMDQGRRTPVFLGVHPGAVQMVVLATGQVTTLFQPSSAATLAVNEAGAGSGFRGMAISNDSFAVIEKIQPEEHALLLGGYGEDRPAERVAVLAGRHPVGPVYCAETFAFCTEMGVALVDMRNRKVHQALFPTDFEVLIARRREGFRVPTGTIPLTVDRTANGFALHVAGDEGGAPGILTLYLPGGRGEFQRLAPDASVTSNEDGSLSIAAADEVRVVGNGQTLRLRTPLASAMPVTTSSAFTLTFMQSRGGEHRLRFVHPQGKTPTEHLFTEPALTPESCGTPFLTAQGVAIPYFATRDGPPYQGIVHITAPTGRAYQE